MESRIILLAIFILVILVVSYKLNSKKIPINRFLLKNDRRLCPKELHLLSYRTNLPMRNYYHTITPSSHDWMFSFHKLNDGNVRSSHGSKKL